MGKKKKDDETTNITAKKAKDMPVRQRLLGLRVAVRRRREEGKRLNGRVSEAKTDFENTLKMSVPEDGEEARRRLLDLQNKHAEIDERKRKRAEFKNVCKETETALLFAEITEDGQTLLPGIELDMTPDMARHLKAGAQQVKAADAEAKDSGEEEGDKGPAYPIESAADLDAFSADLEQFIASAGMSSNSLGTPDDTAKGGEVVSMEKKRGRKKEAEEQPQPPAVH